MTATRIMVFVIMVTFLAGTVLTAIPGPNDPRYPDDIVTPRVPCLKNGVFPHPRNCSWFYRCVDRMNVGYYYTYHFECEPGTLFADELDQCVHPYLVKRNCSQTEEELSTTPSNITSTTTTTPNNTISTTTTTESPVTPSNTTSTTTTTTTPNNTTTTSTSTTTTTSTTTPPNIRTDPPPATPDCHFKKDVCETYNICKPLRKTLDLCWACYVGTKPISILEQPKLGCIEGQLYDPDERKCISKPNDEDLCP